MLRSCSEISSNLSIEKFCMLPSTRCVGEDDHAWILEGHHDEEAEVCGVVIGEIALCGDEVLFVG